MSHIMCGILFIRETQALPLLILILLFVLALFGVIFYGYNRLVEMRNVITRTFAQVDTVLQKRADLIPALVEVTKGYAKHEHDTLVGISAARARAEYSTQPGTRVEDEVRVAKEIKSILALKEAYPDLKANEEFLNLMRELGIVEAQIAEQREAFNNVVKVYNDYVLSFPTTVLAQVFGFAPADYFDFGPDARVLPAIDFRSAKDDDLIELGPIGDANGPDR